MLTALNAAVHAREVLRFDYASASSPETDTMAEPPRRVEPHHLVASAGRWYLIAWDLDRADWRIFRADRVSAPRTPTGPRFAPRPLPGGDVAAFVTARFQGGAPPCRGQAILHLPAAEVAPFVGDGIVEEAGSDRCRVTLSSWSWPGLATAFGRFDADIEVVGPSELMAAFAHLARRYAKAARS